MSSWHTGGEMVQKQDPFKARKMIETPIGELAYYELGVLSEHGIGQVDRLPYSIRILLEAALRNQDGFTVTPSHARSDCKL